MSGSSPLHSIQTVSLSQIERPVPSISSIPFYPRNHSNLPPATTNATLADFPSSPIERSPRLQPEVAIVLVKGDESSEDDEIEYYQDSDVESATRSEVARYILANPYIPIVHPQQVPLDEVNNSSSQSNHKSDGKIVKRNDEKDVDDRGIQNYYRSDDASQRDVEDYQQMPRKLFLLNSNHPDCPILTAPKIPLLINQRHYNLEEKLDPGALLEQFLDAESIFKSNPDRLKQFVAPEKLGEREEEEQSASEESSEDDEEEEEKESESERKENRRKQGRLQPMERPKRASTNYKLNRSSPISQTSGSQPSSSPVAKKSKSKSKNSKAIRTSILLKDLPQRTGLNEIDIWDEETEESVEVTSAKKKRVAKSVFRRRKKSKRNHEESEGEEDPKSVKQREARLQEYRELEKQEFEVEIMAA